MAREQQEPELHKGDDTMGDFETHPAYGQIAVSRISGHAYLYGSDFEHPNYVVVRINESQLNRSLSRDWAFSRKGIIEVAMSEAQWATFVSSFNQGSGVQCTIQNREGEGSVPGIPAPNRTAKFNAEANEDLQDIRRELNELRQKLEENTAGLSKAKAQDLLKHVNLSIRAVSDSLPFVASQMEEHMENVVEAAKAEVHGYLSAQINRAGLAALGAKPDDVLLLNEPSS